MDTSNIEGKLLSGRVYPEFYQLPQNASVVNLGCGLGPQAIVYREQFSQMVGVDINEERVRRSAEFAEWFGVEGYRAIVGNVEDTELDRAEADVVLAIDVIEHVQSPERLVAECRRLLRPGGSLLITYPTMHDKYQHNRCIDAAKFIARRKSRHLHHPDDEWDPDHHNTAMSVGQWIELTEAAGFKLAKSRATTLFPPLHLYGVPKFWFKFGPIHAVDSIFAGLPGVKRFGQALLCRYKAA